MRETFDILPKQIGWRTDKIGYEPPQKKWMENEAVKQRILHSRSSFANLDIASIKVKNLSYQAENALDGGKTNWKFLMIEKLFDTTL